MLAFAVALTALAWIVVST